LGFAGDQKTSVWQLWKSTPESLAYTRGNEWVFQHPGVQKLWRVTRGRGIPLSFPLLAIRLLMSGLGPKLQ